MTSIAESVNVLVIDDQSTMRKILRQLLGQVGIRNVIEAESGTEALKVISGPAGHTLDLAICDLYMKGMDGLDFCNRLRFISRQSGQTIPIIILTGEKEKLFHEIAMQVGAMAVLTKPVSPEALSRALQRAIGFAALETEASMS